MKMNGILLFAFILFSLIVVGEMKTKTKSDYPSEQQLMLQKKETTAADFTRLLVMRVFYGLVKVMGLEEEVGELLNGAFVPPGANDDDDFDDDDGLFEDY